MSDNLLGLYYSKLTKSLLHLEYSYNKALSLDTNPKNLAEEQLEAWDAYASRFARSSDIFLSKFIKAYIKKDDPAFDGSFRDTLHRAEKLQLINNSEEWYTIREMRNVVVHEYSDDDLSNFFKQLLKYTPQVLELRKKLANAAE